MVRLGDRVKDRISGFAGIVTGRFEYLNGCVRFCVAPERTNKDGQLQDDKVFDEEQLVVMKAKALKLGPKEPTGGPRDDDHLTRR